MPSHNKMKPILFKSEVEMQFWMGIYQTAMRDNSSLSGAGCESDYWDSPERTPGETADTAVRELRLRMEPPAGQYHNSPTNA